MYRPFNYRKLLYAAPAVLAGFLTIGCATKGDVRNLEHKLGMVSARAEEAINIGVDASQRSSRAEFSAFVLGSAIKDIKQDKIPGLEKRVEKIEESPHSYRVLQAGSNYDAEFGRMIQLAQSRFKDKTLGKNAANANIMYIGETPTHFVVVLGYDANNDGLLTEGRLRYTDASGRIVEAEDRIFNDLDDKGNLHAIPIEKNEVPLEIREAILRLKTVKIGSR